jgi:hypothetical protein
MGQAEQERQEGTNRTGQAEKEKQNRQAEDVRQGRTARAGLSGKECRNRISKTGQLEQL